MSEEDATALANRADHHYRNEPGYLGCYVKTNKPMVHAFRFTTAAEAMRFQSARQLESTQLEWLIDDQVPTEVLRKTKQA